MNTLVIIGAGCSKGLANLPTDISFMDDSAEEIRRSHFLLKALETLYVPPGTPMISAFSESWRQERLEVCWNEINENYKNAKIILKSADIDQWFEPLPDLAKEETGKEYKYYSEFLLKGKESWSPYKFLFNFAKWELQKIAVKKYSHALSQAEKGKYDLLLQKIRDRAEKGQVTFVSFNYDNLLEQVLDSRWDYLGPSFRTILNDANHFCVIKPHGSVTWFESGDSIEMRRSAVPLEEVGFKNDILYQHSIIGLVGNKINEPSYDASFVQREYELIVESLSKAVSIAEQIIIIGYSFPITDGHIRGAFLGGGNNGIRKIIVVNHPTEKNGSVLLKKISEIFRVDPEVIEPYFGGVEEWIGSRNKISAL